jgi:hypothetical protein
MSHEEWKNAKTTNRKGKTHKNLLNEHESNLYWLSNEKKIINNQCFLFENEFNTFKDVLYFELAEVKFDRLQLQIRAFEKESCENERLTNKGRFKLDKVKHRKLSALKAKLNSFKQSTLDKKSFIQETCTTAYITWDDITFDRNKIRISPNKVFVQPLEIPGSIKVFNEIKVDYFKRKFKKNVYKIVVYKGIVMEELSNGPSQIRMLISEHVADMERKKNKDNIQKEFSNQEFTGAQFLNKVSKLAVKNEYLTIPAKLIKKSDKIFGLLENNKGQEEEALLFCYYFNEYQLLLWENINPNRAAYLFVFKKVNETGLTRLKSIIQSNIDYKRYNLFMGTDVNKSFNLDCLDYYQLNHFDIQEYSKKLTIILNEYER